MRRNRAPRFHSNLRDLRERRGVTLEVLAGYCNVSPATIRLIEEGTYEPSIVLAMHIASCIEQPVGEVFIAIPPSELRQKSTDERIEAVSNQRTSIVAYVLIFGALIASNIFYLIGNEETLAEVLFAVWGVGAVLFLTLISFIPDYWGFQHRANNGAAPKWKKVAFATGQGLFFATAMVLFNHEGNHLVRTYLLNALFFGVSMYFINYGFQFRNKRHNAGAGKQ